MNKRPVLIINYIGGEPRIPEKEEPSDWCEHCGGDGNLYDHRTGEITECQWCHGTGHEPQPCPRAGHKEGGE